MSKKLAISIGIPAYNEETNIQNLLNSIREQKEENFSLKEILVVSDGSSDKTEERVKELKDRRIILIADQKRQGKSKRLNQIFRLFKGDALFLFDADIFVKNKYFFADVIKNTDFTHNALVSVKTIPLPSSNLFERFLNYSVAFQMDIREKWNNGNNYLAFRGSFLALDKKFAKSIELPSGLINNDTVLYFLAVKKGYTPRYLKSIAVYYKSPTTFRDHLSQSSRFQSSFEEMQKFLTVDKHDYSIPKNIFVFTMVKYFLKNPFHFFGYLVIAIITRCLRQKKVKSAWTIASSTKTINTIYG